MLQQRTVPSKKNVGNGSVKNKIANVSEQVKTAMKEPYIKYGGMIVLLALIMYGLSVVWRRKNRRIGAEGDKKDKAQLITEKGLARQGIKNAKAAQKEDQKFIRKPEKYSSEGVRLPRKVRRDIKKYAKNNGGKLPDNVAAALKEKQTGG